jgi:hypothetical protein
MKESTINLKTPEMIQDALELIEAAGCEADVFVTVRHGDPSVVSGVLADLMKYRRARDRKAANEEHVEETLVEPDEAPDDEE